MINELTKALIKAMRFRNINPESISTVDSNVGFIWFKAGEQTYFVGIQKAEFDLDEYADQQS